MAYATPLLEDDSGAPYPQPIQEALAPLIVLASSWQGTVLGDYYAAAVMSLLRTVAESLATGGAYVEEEQLREISNLLSASRYDGADPGIARLYGQRRRRAHDYLIETLSALDA